MSQVMMISLVVAITIFVGGAAFLVRSRAAAVPEDEALLAALQRQGSDLSKPHEIEYILYFRDADSALKAEPEIREAGPTTDVHKDPNSRRWVCVATHRVVPTLQNIKTMSRLVTQIGNDKGGDYGGWTCAIVSAETTSP